MALLGFNVADVEAGSATVTARVGTQHLNLHGTAHGGFLYTLADAAFALASNSHGVVAVALATSMQYFRPVRLGDLIQARASEIHLGRGTAGYRVDLSVEGELVAAFSGTVHRRS